jgi:HEPN domain-containing protein
MTPRLQAWWKQAENDLAMAEFAREGGFFPQACYHCSQAAEKSLKALSRMTTATRYPDGDEAPVDLFDVRDCEQALAIARSVLASVREQLQPPEGPG